MAAGSFASRLKLSYFAQPLKRQWVATVSPRAVFDEKRAGVAGPASVGRMMKELDRVQIGVALAESPADAGLVAGTIHQNANPLDAREVAHDFAVEPRDGREFSRPIGFFVRPGHPGGRVRLPFGGHAKLHFLESSSQRLRIGA